MAHITIAAYAGDRRDSHRSEVAALFSIKNAASTLAERAIAGINRRRAAYTDSDIPLRLRRDIGLGSETQHPS